MIQEPVASDNQLTFLNKHSKDTTNELKMVATDITFQNSLFPDFSLITVTKKYGNAY